MGKAVRVIVITLLVLCVQTVQATPVVQTYGVFDVTFHNNGDSDGYVTGGQNWTSEQMADVGAAIGAWTSNIDDVPARQVSMHLFWTEMDGSGTNVLGGSTSYRIGNGTTQWNFGEYVWREGIDPGTTSYGFDTVIQYDITAAGVSWNFGSGSPGSGEIDFRSVITHEIGHSLGWSSTYDYSFDDWGWMYTDTYGDYYGLTEWDKNLVDSSGNRPNNGGRGTPGNFNEADNPVYFDGANAVGYYGDNVPIYAPSPYQPGSSLSHLDETLLSDSLMSPSFGTGQMIREVSELEWAIMEDLGWSTVPEPAAFLLLSFGAMILRRNRKF